MEVQCHIKREIILKKKTCLGRKSPINSNEKIIELNGVWWPEGKYSKGRKMTKVNQSFLRHFEKSTNITARPGGLPRLATSVRASQDDDDDDDDDDHGDGDDDDDDFDIFLKPYRKP